MNLEIDMNDGHIDVDKFKFSNQLQMLLEMFQQFYNFIEQHKIQWNKISFCYRK